MLLNLFFPHPILKLGIIADNWILWNGSSTSVSRFVSPQPVEATDDAFWDQFWADTATSVQDVFALVPAAEIRAVREESPSNLATLCYKVSLDPTALWFPRHSRYLVSHNVLACPCLLLRVILNPSFHRIVQTIAGI